MEAAKSGMRTIWFFVGLLLSVIGFVVIVAGLYDLFYPASPEATLANLHANIWWGMLILLTGVVYVVKNKNKYSSAS